MNTGSKGDARKLYLFTQERLERFFKDVPADREYSLSLSVKLTKIRGPEPRCRCGRLSGHLEACTPLTQEARDRNLHCRECLKGTVCAKHCSRCKTGSCPTHG